MRALIFGLCGLVLAAQPARAQDQAVADVQQRVLLNGYFLPKTQFATYREARQRAVQLDVRQVAEPWSASVNEARERLGLNGPIVSPMNAAPLNVTVERQIQAEWGGRAYVIDILTWDALPGLRMPAVIYRPADREGRYPAVLNPPSCGESPATHKPGLSSVQRRMVSQATAGMVAFTTLGFCYNGAFATRPEMAHQLGYWGLVAGANVNTRTLETVIWLRALRMLEERRDVDRERIAVTGYGNGSNIATTLFEVEPKLAALADVNWSKAEQFEERGALTTYTHRLGNRFDYLHSFYHGGYRWGAGSDWSPKAPDPLSQEEFEVARDYGRPRPILLVMGTENKTAYYRHTDQVVTLLKSAYSKLGAPEPKIQPMPGGQQFDESRGDLVTAWLAQTLVTQKPVSMEGFTPRPADELEAVVPSTGSLFGFVKPIAERAITTARPVEDKAALGAAIKVSPAPAAARPILLDEWIKDDVRYEYWLLGVRDGLSTGMFLCQPFDGDATSTTIRIALEGGRPVAEELAACAAGKASAVVIMPGYGVASSGEFNTGNLAGILAQDGETLLGISVDAARAAVSLMVDIAPDAPIELLGTGIEAGIIVSFAVPLDNRIARGQVIHGLRSFTELMNQSRPLFSPPIMLGGRIGLVGDIAALQAMANGRLTITSPPDSNDLLQFTKMYENVSGCVQSKVMFANTECEKYDIP